MKSVIIKSTTIFVLIYMVVFLSFGQVNDWQKEFVWKFDWENIALKGNVLTMQESRYEWRNKFGEYVRDEKPIEDNVSPVVFFNPDGMIWKMDYKDYDFKMEYEETGSKFFYEDGKLKTIYRFGLNKIPSGLYYNTLDTILRDDYIYDNDRVIEINHYQNTSYTHGWKLMSKTKYKHTTDGYEMKKYDGNGALYYWVIMDGKTKKEGDVIIGEKNRIKVITEYDNKMNPIVGKEIIYDIWGVHRETIILRFKYNDNNELVAIYEDSKNTPTWTYQYVYDEQNNWIEKKRFHNDIIQISTVRTISYANSIRDYDGLARQDKFNQEFIEKEIARGEEIKAEHDKKNEMIARQQKLAQKRSDSINCVNQSINRFHTFEFLFDSHDDYVSCIIKPTKEMSNIIIPLINNKIQDISSTVITGKELKETNNESAKNLMKIIDMMNYMDRGSDYPYKYYNSSSGEFVNGRTNFGNVFNITYEQLQDFVIRRKYLKKQYDQWKSSYWNGSNVVDFLQCFIQGKVK